jgi:hypothetical protein
MKPSAITHTLLAAALAIGGWGLATTHGIAVKQAANTAQIERIDYLVRFFHRVEIQPPAETEDAVYLATWRAEPVGENPQYALDVLRRAAIYAVERIKSGDSDGAVKALRIGLEETGLRCEDTKGGLECR